MFSNGFGENEIISAMHVSDSANSSVYFAGSAGAKLILRQKTDLERSCLPWVCKKTKAKELHDTVENQTCNFLLHKFKLTDLH